MSRPIKHACADCGRPRWRHKEGSQLPNTCERFKTSKAAAKAKAEAIDSPGCAAACPEPMTGGE